MRTRHLQNRSGLVLATMAALCTLVALGVGLSGYRSTPRRAEQKPRILADPSNPEDKDPLAPRLFDQSAPFRVHVAGAVKKPGVYALPSWARVIDAVKKAGGAAPTADLDAINLADKIEDGEQIRIPTRGRPQALDSHRPTPEPDAVPATVGGRSTARYPFAAGAVELQAAGAGPVNLNSASREQLDSLPGIGPATADRIVAYREEHGPFVRPEDLMNVQGIGEVRFAQLRSLVTAP